MTRRPDFVTYFGTPAPLAFVPFPFWQYPLPSRLSRISRATMDSICAYLTDPWGQA